MREFLVLLSETPTLASPKIVYSVKNREGSDNPPVLKKSSRDLKQVIHLIEDYMSNANIGKQKLSWIKFKVYPEIEGNTIEGAYAKDVDGEYRVKLVSKVPRGYYYSFLNDAESEFDQKILPQLIKQ